MLAEGSTARWVRLMETGTLRVSVIDTPWQT